VAVWSQAGHSVAKAVLVDTEILLPNLLILFVSIIIMGKVSDFAIDNTVKISEISGLGKTTVGFVLLGFSTSLPELSVSIIAALIDEVGVPVGNALGSNIVDVSLIMGLPVLLVALKKPEVNMTVNMVKEEFSSLYFGLFTASLIPLSLMYLAHASRIVGLILLIIFLIYTYHLSKREILTEGAEERVRGEAKKLDRYVLLTSAGVIGVIAVSYFVVYSASNIAEIIGVPKILMGATIVAFGTSLPELTLNVKAIAKEQWALAFGNIVGSCFINITLILGIPLIASPLNVNMKIFSDLILFSLIDNLFLWYFLTSGRMGWKEGAILLFLYLLFLATTFGVISKP